MSTPAFATYPSLSGRPVLISGGASGIGESLVRAFAAQGARVGFVDIAQEAGQALENELAEAGRRVRFVPCDVTDIAAYRDAIGAIAADLGDPLVLINNAANDERHSWRDLSPEQWDQRIAVNLKHAFFAIQAVAPGMIAAGGGSIVNFGSMSWMVLGGNMPGYTASKAAMHGLSRSLARDLGPHNIRVNTLVPGWVMTERQLTRWVDADAEREIDANQALKGRVMPQDVARMALFLAADDSMMISAQDFIVDGGWAHG